MDVDDYKKKYGEPETLEQYLNYAAFIMRQCRLEHRTLHHFNFFVQSLIFGKTYYKDFLREFPNGDPAPGDITNLGYTLVKSNAEGSLKIYEKYNTLYTCEENPWRKYGKAFVEYCEQEYGDDDGC